MQRAYVSRRCKLHRVIAVFTRLVGGGTKDAHDICAPSVLFRLLNLCHDELTVDVLSVEFDLVAGFYCGEHGGILHAIDHRCRPPSRDDRMANFFMGSCLIVIPPRHDVWREGYTLSILREADRYSRAFLPRRQVSALLRAELVDSHTHCIELESGHFTVNLRWHVVNSFGQIGVP